MVLCTRKLVLASEISARWKKSVATGSLGGSSRLKRTPTAKTMYSSARSAGLAAPGSLRP
jgi:hypothetical protein